MVDFLLDWLVWSPCSPRDSQESSPAPEFKRINSSMLSLLYGPTLTSLYDYWKNYSFEATDLCQLAYHGAIPCWPSCVHSLLWECPSPSCSFGHNDPLDPTGLRSLHSLGAGCTGWNLVGADVSPSSLTETSGLSFITSSREPRVFRVGSCPRKQKQNKTKQNN